MNNLYNDLVELVKNEKNYGFMFLDLEYDDRKYRIFDYGVTSWTEFQKRNAVNCRGTMFDITDEENPKLVSFPPPKFFNYHEGLVDHVNNKEVTLSMLKRDGSLISTYLHNDEVMLKSKGHLFSDQAKWANKLLQEKYVELKNELNNLIKNNYTVNMEYTAPNNTIVVFYGEEQLTILNIRSNITGELFYGDKLREQFSEYKEVLNNLVEYKVLNNVKGENITTFINSVLEETEGEGYVIEIKSLIDNESYLVKIKNNKYVLLHHTKAAIESPVKVIECILESQLDDLRALFGDDKEIQNYLTKLEFLVIKRFNEFKNKIETFYEENKGLDLKSYALKAEAELSIMKGLAFNLYKGKPADYKQFLLKNKESFFPEIKFSGERNYKKIII